MAKIKSPLRYPGGKSRAAEWLVSLFPDFKEYREPFLGGGSVYIKTKQMYLNKKYWVNDLYYDLYCFWEALQCQPTFLQHYIGVWKTQHPDGRELYKYLTENLFMFSGIERAAAFFILNRITFSGTSLSGGYSQEAFEKRFTESSIKRLMDVYHLFDLRVEITNLDYSKLLEAEGEDVFIFMDPPYHSATKSALYGKNGELHIGFDHERFAEEVKKCKHKWMITYDDCEYIRELFKDYQITPFELMYGMRNVSKGNEMKGKEILITNYEINDGDKQNL